MGLVKKSFPSSFRFSTDAMKLIAVTAMFIDHLPLAFGTGSYYTFPVILMHMLGRFTAPIMFYGIVKGYHHTRNANRYMGRLLIFALISYAPYIYYFEGAWPNSENFLQLNVLFSLFLGLLALRAKKEIRIRLLRYGAIGGIFLLSLFTEWQFLGILLILLFYSFSEDRRAMSISYALVILTYSFSMSDRLFRYLPEIREQDLITFLPYLLVISSMLLPLLVIRNASGQKGHISFPGGKWFFYIFYPLHIVFLICLRAFLLGGFW